MTRESNSELQMFRDATASFLDKTSGTTAARALSAENAAFSREWWGTAVELGWTSLIVPEELGGGSPTGEGVADLVDLARVLGSRVAAGPLHPVSVVLSALAESGRAEHAELIEDLVGGEKIAAWAVGTNGSRWAPLEPAVRAERSASGWTLDGRVGPVQFAGEADVLLVPAASADGLIEVLVDAHDAGVTISPTRSIDLVRSAGSIDLTGVTVAADQVVFDETGAARAVERQARLAQLLQVAETVGVLDTVFADTVTWAFDRYSFGRPLASYQALKHRFSDMKLWLESARAIVMAAGAAVQQDADDATLLVSAAKSYVGDRSVQIIQDCVQLHGGIGVTMEHDIHIYLRRAVIDRMSYGTPREHRDAVATLIGM